MQILLSLICLAAAMPLQEETESPYGFREGDSVNVQVLRTFLKKQARILSGNVASVERGAEVRVDSIDTRRGFAKVTWTKPDGSVLTGWLPCSTLMPQAEFDAKEAGKKIDVDNPNDAEGFSGTEAAVAKGFNPQIEAKLRQDDKSVDQAYKELDKLQELAPRELNEEHLKRLEAFRKEGKLGEFSKAS